MWIVLCLWIVFIKYHYIKYYMLKNNYIFVDNM